MGHLSADRLDVGTVGAVSPRTHRFNIRHNFSPEAAFELYELIRALILQEAGDPVAKIKDALRATASPLIRRRDLSKTLATIDDLGLIEVSPKTVRCQLGVVDRFLGNCLWRRKFVSVVHSLYSLGYRDNAADPRWSCPVVCRILIERAPIGVTKECAPAYSETR